MEYLEDTRRIRRVLIDNGYLMSEKECNILWRAYSDLYAANWIALPEGDDELWSILDFARESLDWWDEIKNSN